MKNRIAVWAADKEYVEVRELFGVTCFLYLGNFMAADDGGHLVVRLSDSDRRDAMQGPRVKDWKTGGTGSPVHTLIPASNVNTDERLQVWLDKAFEYSKTLEAMDKLITQKVACPQWHPDSEK